MLGSTLFLLVLTAISVELVREKPPSLRASTSASLSKIASKLCGACVEPADPGRQDIGRGKGMAADLTDGSGGTTELVVGNSDVSRAAGVCGFENSCRCAAAASAVMPRVKNMTTEPKDGAPSVKPLGVEWIKTQKREEDTVY